MPNIILMSYFYRPFRRRAGRHDVLKIKVRPSLLFVSRWYGSIYFVSGRALSPFSWAVPGRPKTARPKLSGLGWILHLAYLMDPPLDVMHATFRA
jgi:hypothetical protein